MSAPWRKEVLHRLVAGRRRAPKRAGPRRLPGARLPLRVQLVATLVVLVLAALLVTGVAAATALRSYLLDRVDAQLRGLATTQVGRILAGGPLDPDAGQGLDARGGHAGAGAGSSLPSAFYLAILRGDGTLIGQVADTIPGSHATPVLPTLTASDVAARGGHAFTVAGSSGSGTWRLLATAAGSSGASVVVGMSLTDLTDTVGQLELIELVAGVVVLVVLAGLGYTVVRRSLRPLVEVERTADAIAAGDLTRRVPERDVRSEVGKLGGALNAMLGQIESAFRSREASEAAARASEERMRRFVADASHELRTPLTSIRGFAELFRQGAAGDADDVARMLRRIEDEAARMGLLVDDLLLLARLDQQRPLERAPVDLLTLVADAVQDARARDPGRPIDLELLPEGPAPAVVLGDDARLRQVLANLLSNTLRHTPPGAAVTVRVGVQDRDGVPRAVLEVADTGPGMTAEDAARVFERFYRVDTSRTRASGGVGLGLSIVAALVAAHGGRVSVDTAPGAGCLFRVELPLPDGGVGPAEAGR